MWVWILLAAFIYLMLGCFHIGFADLRIDEDGVAILWTIFLWPVFLDSLSGRPHIHDSDQIRQETRR